MFIRIKNTLVENAPITFLSFSALAGAGGIRVKNSNDFQVNYYAQIGQTGEQQTEIVQVTGTAAGSLTTSTALYNHPEDTPIFPVKYNKVIVNRSTAGTTGTATALGTVSITPNQTHTQYEDTASTSGYAYTAQFYNSALDTSTPQSAWIVTSGYNPYSRQGIREAAKRRIKNIPGVEDDDINCFIDEYMELMRNAAVQVNEDYGLGTVTVAMGAGTAEYTITDDSYRTPVRVWGVSGAGTVIYNPIFTSDIDPRVNYEGDARFYLPGDNAIGFLPTPNTGGTAYIVCNTLDTRLDSDDDLLPRPMRTYITGFIDYILEQVYRQDNRPQLAEARGTSALRKIEQFKVEINPRQRVKNEQVLEVADVTFMNDFSNGGF